MTNDQSAPASGAQTGYGLLAGKGKTMGLFDVLADVVSMPVRIAVDVVKLPKQIAEGDDLFENTANGIKKLEDDLDK